MFETIVDHFQHSPMALWGPFFVLLLCGLGLPVPEDVVLIAAGALGLIDGRSWVFVSAVMYVGVMMGDSTIFLAGRYFGGRLRSARWFQRFFSEAKQNRVEALFDRYHSAGLFIGRFLPGLRAPLFFTAGSMKIRYWSFFLYDGLAALVSVPVFVWLGYWLWRKFGTDLEQLQLALGRTQSYALMVTLVLAGLMLLGLIRWYRRTKDRSS